LRWHDDLANTIGCGKSDDKFESVEMNTMTSSLYPKLPSAPLESEEPKYGDKDLYDVTTVCVNGCDTPILMNNSGGF